MEAKSAGLIVGMFSSDLAPEFQDTRDFFAGVDGCRAGFDQVREGKQGVCIGQSFTNMAIKCLENARAMLDGQTVEKVNFIPLDVVTLETIDSFPYPEW